LWISVGIYADWWFGTFGLFFHSVGNFLIPTDEVIFFRGVAQPPTRSCSSLFAPHWRYLPYIRPKFQGIIPHNMVFYGTAPPF
jgi:hypothetical protein